jgi:hypothetical protein
VRADIHDGQEHKRSMQGPDTDAQDQPPPFVHIRLATHGRSADIPYPRRQVCFVPFRTHAPRQNGAYSITSSAGLRTRDEHLKRNREQANQARPCCSPCAADEHMRAAEVAHVSEYHRLVVQELASAPRKRARPPAISGGPFPFPNSRATRGTAVPAISISCREENKQP